MGASGHIIAAILFVPSAAVQKQMADCDLFESRVEGCRGQWLRLAKQGVDAIVQRKPAFVNEFQDSHSSNNV